MPTYTIGCVGLIQRERGTQWCIGGSVKESGAPHNKPLPDGDPCPKQYAYVSIDKGHISKPRTAYQEHLGRNDEWNTVRLRETPVSTALVKLYLEFARE